MRLCLAVLVLMVALLVRPSLATPRPAPAPACRGVTPQFSRLTGRPNISRETDESGITGLVVSWSPQQILFAPECADAFEVEWQEVQFDTFFI